MGTQRARPSRLAQLEQRLRADIDALRASGLSFNAIAAVLNRRGIPGLQGGRWYAATVRRALNSPPQPATAFN
ncbi:hypothetical protein ASD15_09110 [Massilia sp. Root351]|jgi:hypothetical protein|uniref:recombinase family protein n=1 Tax=Massilia sp. Root351 TaxID=1736522 RepID=UPI00071001F1|nr:recombinase family protein [Massilia sp. Root351]KQV82210.1 hypothetical protein ASD15_09110 [Massilia sp. Root351]